MCWFILFQHTNVYLFAKFGDLMPMIDKKQRPQIWTCSWARRRNKIPHRNFEFHPTKCFINVNQLSWWTNCAAENSKPQDMLRDQRGDSPSKIWIKQVGLVIRSRASRLGNKINWLHEERSVGVKMLMDLVLRTRGLAQHLAPANARAKVRAHTHNLLIWCQGSSLTKGCVMAHSKSWKIQRMEEEILIIQSIQLGFSRSLGSNIKWS